MIGKSIEFIKEIWNQSFPESDGIAIDKEHWMQLQQMIESNNQIWCGGHFAVTESFHGMLYDYLMLNQWQVNFDNYIQTTKGFFELVAAVQENQLPFGPQTGCFYEYAKEALETNT